MFVHAFVHAKVEKILFQKITKTSTLNNIYLGQGNSNLSM